MYTSRNLKKEKNPFIDCLRCPLMTVVRICKQISTISLIHKFLYSPHLSRVRMVLENLESPGILLWHFPGLESPGKRLLVLESSGNLLNSSKTEFSELTL